MIPPLHDEYLHTALPALQGDRRILGVAAGGSWLSRSLDEYSDLDLVVVVKPEHFPAVMEERQQIAAGLGPRLLAAFTGEHVGEPRLLICLYGPPPLHVDLKFVTLPDLAKRIEDPAILWEREGRLSEVIQQSSASFPPFDLQWAEDRFWVWIHYTATKIGRGELFDAISALDFVRSRVLGPLLLIKHGHLPTGVRRIEQRAAPAAIARLQETLAPYEATAIAAATRATADLYCELRLPYLNQGSLIARVEAEAASLEYLEQIRRAIPNSGR